MAKNLNRGDGEESIPLQALLDMSIDARLDRAASAAENAATALTRIADAFETFNALLGSVVGTASVTAYRADNSMQTAPGKYLRCGSGRETFRETSTNDADD